MGYETLHVHLGNPDPEKRKAQIEADAEAMGMSISKFLVWCYEQVRPKLGDIARKESQTRLSKIK